MKFARVKISLTQFSASVSSLASTLSRSATTATANSRDSRSQMDNQSIITNAPSQDEVFLDDPFLNSDFHMPTKLGFRSFSSFYPSSRLGLDWALVRLSRIGIEEAQRAKQTVASHQSTILPQKIIERLERDGTVIIPKRHGAISRGSVSSSPIMMRLPHDSSFQEVWTIRLDVALSKLRAKA